jgi:hypothetical protein
MDEPDDSEGLLSRPIEVSIKPWQILAALGAGSFILYLLLKKKDEPAPTPTPAQQAKPSQPAAPQAKPPGEAGTSGYVLLGEQDEPLYEGHPLVGNAREYAKSGWTVFKVPTGNENVMRNRQRFDVQAIYAAPPGRRIPRRAERVEF